MFPFLIPVGIGSWVPGNDAYTKLMLHGQGTDGSQSFTDSSASPHTMSVGGGAQIDTAQKKFGKSSILFDGNGDYLYTTDTTNFSFGTGDFTIDFWMRPNVLGVQLVIDFRSAGVNVQQGLLLNASGGIQYFSNGLARITSANGSVPAGQWTHVAVVRLSGTTKLYINGVAVNAGFSDGQNYSCGNNRPFIGGDGYSSTYWFNGWLSEVRLSKGIARWSADFTPPVVPYGPY